MDKIREKFEKYARKHPEDFTLTEWDGTGQELFEEFLKETWTDGRDSTGEEIQRLEAENKQLKECLNDENILNTDLDDLNENLTAKNKQLKEHILEVIHILCDYDGYTTIEGFKGLIDDVVYLHKQALKETE